MAAADRLSTRPDDVLVRILSLAPKNEAAATALLSRRWRSLWRRTSAVNLDSRPYAEAERGLCSFYPSRLQSFFRDAHAILAALQGEVLKRLTLFLDKEAYYISKSRRRKGDDAEPNSRVTKLLADPVVARLEELTIGCGQGHEREHRYFPPLASLPAPPSSGCWSSRADMVDAAPALTSLTLVNVSQRAVKLPGSNQRFYEPDYFMLPLRLRCLTFNALVLVTYVDKKAIKASAAGGSGIELDMPSLRFFRFKGYPVKLSLTSPAPGLARVDFDVDHRHQGGCEILNYEPLSRMTASFSSTRALKVRLKCIEDIVADEDEDAGIILPTFPNLKLLELDGEYQYMDSNTAVATARILRSCPVMSELRLRLAMRYYNYWYDRKHEDPVGGPFSESMDRFERLASMSSAVDLGGVSELPDALTNDCAFRCLQTSLRKVTLQFKAKEVNCFPAQLAKFLVENAMVLEEMHVNDGSQFWLDHLCHKEMERRVFPAEEPAGRGRRVSSVPAAAG
ncbi:putative F-box/LRR-repeat protein At3g44090 [Aegilops tauschii subsp. strangulata]|uniref:putative F-box/LRR-repeat protein At3g44090 n=1 Tax=Aegilops tauschii subsp. strangulata TaxID=200361 RepID=UPI003CC875C6